MLMRCFISRYVSKSERVVRSSRRMSTERRSLRSLRDEGDRGERVVVSGWIRSLRAQKRVTFANLCDGSTVDPLQIVSGDDRVRKSMATFATGSCVRIEGTLVEQRRKNRSSGERPVFEIVAESCAILGDCDAASYPLQKKYHSLDFLREQLHLRPRSRTIGAVTRVRSEAAHALQTYLRDHEFLQVHTPVLTSNDCEGAGELFEVISGRETSCRGDTGTNDEEGFFGDRGAYLTVSGQLQAEMFACALSRVYAFGPTFRAENSQTRRHLAEFWMLEPEMAFATLEDILDVSEGMVRHCVAHLLERCDDDLAFFEQRLLDDNDDDKRKQNGTAAQEAISLRDMLRSVANEPFRRLTYTEAVDELENAVERGDVAFDYPIRWGLPLQTEHERWLSEMHCEGRAVFVTNYPAACKPFYMRADDEDDDRPTVGAVDLLVPRIGELVGGSEREERYDRLSARMSSDGLLPELDWYLDLRKYGTVRHGGFGLGFERLLMFVTGLENIRDVIAFPRHPGSIKF